MPRRERGDISGTEYMQNEHNSERLDLSAIRQRLAGSRGPQFWRSLEEVAETKEFQQFVEDEFPNRSSLLNVDRRQFLTLMGASLAMAGLAGCRALPQEKIVPYVQQPEEIVPGKPLSFATAVTLGGYAQGVLVESREGRPVKIEGNPDHPASLGALDAFGQASLLNLYDPDRAQNVLFRGNIATWEAFIDAAGTALAREAASGGAGIRILTETITSPTLIDQIQGLLRRYPAARWYQYDPVSRDGVREGAVAAFGRPVQPVYRFDAADVILSLDADFLLTLPGHVRYARDFIDGRRVRADRTAMNRLYVVESTYTITGSMADHRLAVKPSQVETIARALAVEFGLPGATAGELPTGVRTEWLTALAADLRAAGARAVVVPGDEQPAAVHAIAHAMNQALGSAGRAVTYTAPVEAGATVGTAAIEALSADLDAGRVTGLFIIGANPAYTAPADLDIAGKLQRFSADRNRFSACLSMYADETAAICQWLVPETHYLEAWGDARAYDGTVSVIQPLIEPLYRGRSAIELVAAVQGQGRAGYDIVRDYWRRQNPGGGFDAWWERVLNRGLVPGSALPAAGVTARTTVPAAAATAAQGLEISFRPDPTIWDGRYNNNGWLQELPKPVTKLTWDNAVLVSPRTAQRLDLQVHDQVELAVGGRKVQGAVWILPGQPDDSVTVTLGYGRTRSGRVGDEAGFNAYAIRRADAPWADSGVEIRKTGRRYTLASTQAHHPVSDTSAGSGDMMGRDIIRVADIATFTQAKGHVGPQGLPGGADTPADTQEESHADHGSGMVPGVREGLSEQAGGPAKGTTKADTRGEWEYVEDGTVGEEHGEKHPSLYPEYSYKDNYAWGMVIDQNACIGCNACVVACQAENNIPVVGKDQVIKGREMHWIRIDRYHRVGGEDPSERGERGMVPSDAQGGPGNNDPFEPSQTETYFQPMTCMHCEKAPCEPVCPVAATVHSHEGLNMMVYNRCVGTRYCSNNCPYKVRRFNFLKYSAGGIAGRQNVGFDLPVLKMLPNPDVTVRGRGVMEKCTYCVQRINEARIESKKENRRIRDGEVVTACAQTCPTQAIIFGDINDPNSRVAKLKHQPQNYGVLTELNTQPRTSYLPRLRNPNPAIDRLAGRREG